MGPAPSEVMLEALSAQQQATVALYKISTSVILPQRPGTLFMPETDSPEIAYATIELSIKLSLYLAQILRRCL